MPYYAVIDKASGRLLSVASVVGDVDPETTEVKEYSDYPDFGDVMWNEGTRDFIPRPPKVIRDRLNDPDFEALLIRLSTQEKKALKAKIRQWGIDTEY